MVVYDSWHAKEMRKMMMEEKVFKRDDWSESSVSETAGCNPAKQTVQVHSRVVWVSW